MAALQSKAQCRLKTEVLKAKKMESATPAEHEIRRVQPFGEIDFLAAQFAFIKGQISRRDSGPAGMYHHSYRSACIGSIRVACRAGKYAARSQRMTELLTSD